MLPGRLPACNNFGNPPPWQQNELALRRNSSMEGLKELKEMEDELFIYIIWGNTWYQNVRANYWFQNNQIHTETGMGGSKISGQLTIFWDHHWFSKKWSNHPFCWSWPAGSSKVDINTFVPTYISIIESWIQLNCFNLYIYIYNYIKIIANLNMVWAPRLNAIKLLKLSRSDRAGIVDIKPSCGQPSPSQKSQKPKSY